MLSHKELKIQGEQETDVLLLAGWGTTPAVLSVEKQ